MSARRLYWSGIVLIWVMVGIGSLSTIEAFYYGLGIGTVGLTFWVIALANYLRKHLRWQ